MKSVPDDLHTPRLARLEDFYLSGIIIVRVNATNTRATIWDKFIAADELNPRLESAQTNTGKTNSGTLARNEIAACGVAPSQRYAASGEKLPSPTSNQNRLDRITL